MKTSAGMVRKVSEVLKGERSRQLADRVWDTPQQLAREAQEA